MKLLLDFLETFFWESLISIILIIVGIFTIVMIIHPKQHQGYYIERDTDGSLPIYSICNNWDWYPDRTVFTSADIDEVIRVKTVLEGDSK